MAENRQSSDVLAFNKEAEIKNKSRGPKFLIMERTDGNQTMEKVSPFLLKEVISKVGGDIQKCLKIRNGTVLIETKNLRQAENIIKLTKLDSNINIKVSEHPTLNNVKGVVFCPDLNYMEKEHIIENLKDQNVVDIKRMKAKNKINGEIEDSSLYTVIFSTATMPEYINIGYYKISVGPYIPPPLRCMNCLHFGHISVVCKANKKCSNCGENYHLTEENKQCEKPPKCVNCLDTHLTSHHAFSKKCSKYIRIREQEIQRIKVLEKVDLREANRKYKERNPLDRSFSAIVKNGTNKQYSQQNASPNTNTHAVKINGNEAHTDGMMD